jgi:hypothetical protein
VISCLFLSLPNFLHTAKRRLRDLVKPDNYALFANAMADLTHSKTDLIVENAFRRRQLIIRDRQVKCLLTGPVSECCLSRWPVGCGPGNRRC